MTATPKVLQIDEEPDEYAPGMSAKVGSSKRKQLYDKKIARALNESLVESGKECFIYILDLERVREPEQVTNPKRRKFQDPIEYEYCFGFLSAKEIPKVPPFPVYLRQGDMRVRVIKATQTFSATNEQLQEIASFHDYLFTQVLQMCKTENLVFEVSAQTPLNTLIIPLNKSKDGQYSLNMKYVSEVVANMQKMPRVPDDATRRNFKFRPEDYKDAIVMPWYRNIEQPVFCYVAEILTNMRPTSAFPDSHFETFNEYFIKKYNLEIYDQDQSLLDVDYTSSRLNLLLPRLPPHQQRRVRSLSNSSNTSTKAATSSESKDSDVGQTSHSSQRQILVPELMDIHPISATLWNVIAALPSVFYRLNQLLLTDELRETILVKAFGRERDAAQLDPNFEWSPLAYASIYEEKQSIIVKKIQQLRELNKKSVEEQEVKKKVVAPEDDGSFAIGVWDPQEAIRSGVDITRSEMKNEGAAEDMDTVGLNQGLHDGNISDEDEDGLPFVMHDYTARLTSQRQGAGEVELWPGCDQIVPTGWGDDGIGSIPGETFHDVNEQKLPFEILGGSSIGGLNMQALMADVGRVFGPMGSSSTPNVETTIPENPKNSKASVSSNELAAKEQENLRKIQEEMLAKARERVECMEMSEEREKPKRQEEFVDLEQFTDELSSKSDEEQDEDNISFRPRTMDEEIEELTLGASKKQEMDDITVKSDMCDRETCLVLPVAATDLPSRPFSFAKESKTMHGLMRLLKDNDEENHVSHVDADVGMGVSPCLLLTALTTSNAADGMSLERFETIGDSFLKYAVTDYLYHTLLDQHEGKLSFARSKEVSNCNLYRLGKKLGIPQLIVANKFDAHDSWLPPCYIPTSTFKAPNTEDAEERDNEMERILNGQQIEVKEEQKTGWDIGGDNLKSTADGIETINFPKQTRQIPDDISPLPYNLLTQQNISDKAIADAMEALIGVHLLTLGPNPTLKVMSWMGLKVLEKDAKTDTPPPLLRFIDSPINPNASVNALNNLWQQFQFAQLEEKIG
uniref:Uncharacterized protein n=1 Tax=Caenorhabditis japonica TaxID=281687 RepID=A0A8R1E3Z9_CAEJA